MFCPRSPSFLICKLRISKDHVPCRDWRLWHQEPQHRVQVLLRREQRFLGQTDPRSNFAAGMLLGPWPQAETLPPVLSSTLTCCRQNGNSRDRLAGTTWGRASSVSLGDPVCLNSQGRREKGAAGQDKPSTHWEREGAPVKMALCHRKARLWPFLTGKTSFPSPVAFVQCLRITTDFLLNKY